MKEIVNTSYNINQFLNNDLKEAKPTLEDNIEETVINNSLNDIKNIDIYTDGSLVWNSGGININAKGYGVVIVDRDNDNILFKIKGRIKDKTDMLDKTDLVELYAIQRACHFLNNNFNQEHLSNMNISIHTDHNDYVNIYKEALKNPQSYRYPQLWDNIKKISESLNRFSIKWVKGHNNHIYNEMADKLAKSGAYFLKHEEQMVYKSIIEEKDELMNLTENIHNKENRKVRKPL